jgi:hypothetical protein
MGRLFLGKLSVGWRKIDAMVSRCSTGTGLEVRCESSLRLSIAVVHHCYVPR